MIVIMEKKMSYVRLDRLDRKDFGCKRSLRFLNEVVFFGLGLVQVLDLSFFPFAWFDLDGIV